MRVCMYMYVHACMYLYMFDVLARNCLYVIDVGMHSRLDDVCILALQTMRQHLARSYTKRFLLMQIILTHAPTILTTSICTNT